MSLWAKWAADGTNGIRLDLDNQADIVAVDSNGKVRFNRVVTVKARIYNGGTLQTSGISLPTSASSYMSALAIGVVTPVLYHTSINNSNKITGTTTSVTGGVLFIVWTFAKSTQLTANTTWPATIQLKYSNVTYDAAFSLTSSDTDAVYQLKPNKNELAFSVDANNAYTPSELRVKCGYIKDTGSGVTAYEWPSSPTAGKVDDKYWLLYRRIDASGVPVPTFSGAQTEGWNWTYGTVSGERTGGEIIVPNTSTNSAVEFCLSPKGAETTTNSDIIDIESIPIVRSGKAGTSPFIADLDNEMGGVACDSDGYTTSEQYIETNAQLFRGTAEQTLKSSGGVVCSIDGYTLYSDYMTSDPSPARTYKAVITGLGTTTANIKVYVKSGTSVGNVDIKVTLTDTNNVSRDATLTMNGVRGGEKGEPAVLFNLLPSVSTIKKSSDDVLTPTSLTCDVRKITGNSTPTRATSSDGTLRYRVDGDITRTSDGTALTINDGTVDSYKATSKYITFAFFKGTTLVDKERVPIVYDGEKGDNSIRLAIDNEHEDFIYSESGKVAPFGDAESQARLYDGAEPVPASSVGWAFSFDGSAYNRVSTDYIEDALGVAKISSSGLLSVKEIGSDSVSIKVRARYPNNNSGNYYYAEFTANKTQQDKYDIIVTPNAIAYNPSSYSTQTLNISATVTNLQGEQSAATIDTSSSITTGLRVWYAWVNANGSIGSLTSLNAPSLSVTSTNCSNYAGVYFELRLYRGGSLPYLVKDHETVEFAKSQNGISPTIYMLDSSVSYITIPSDSSSATLSATVTAYQKEGTASKTTYSGAYLYLFTRTSSSVIVVDSSNSKRSSITISRSVQRTLVSVGVVMLSSYKAASSVVTDINNGAYMAIVEIPVLANGNTGGSGANAIHLDLDNENDAIQYMGGTNLTVSVTSQARLYGATETISIDRSRSTIGEDYCSISNSGLITVYDVMNSNDQNILSGIVVVKATVNNVDYFATFTVQRLDNGQPKYWLKIDTPAVVGNISNDTASVTVNVQVWRTAINTTTNMLEDTQVSSLSTYDRKLWRQTNSGTPSNATASYVNGVYAHTIDLKTISDSTLSYTYYVTNSISSWSSTDKIIYDKETVPVTKVQNGQQGIQGKMGRTPYYWGKWSEKASTDTFTVSDYMTPYVANGETGGIPQCWIFVGANGSYTKSTAGDPSNTNQKWQLMTSDFEYLITKAIFSDFAKLGSGIFNGDFVFSQEGTIDGWEANTTKAFANPYTCYYPTSSSIKGRDSVSIKNSLVKVNTTTWTAVSDSFTALKGVPYVISFYFASNPRNYYFKVASDQPLSSDTGWWSSQWNYARPYDWATADSSVKVWCRKRDSSESSVQINDIRLTTFVPNLAWNWKTGEIYSQLGHFVNVTVEGVINNLIQEVTSTNISNFGNWTSSGSKLELNPLKIGSLVRFSTSANIYLPCDYVSGGTHYSQFRYGLTLDELRQCVGKKIYVFPSADSIVLKYYCGDNGVQPYGMLVKELEGNTEIPSQVNTSTTLVVNRERMPSLYSSDQSAKNKMVILECKMTIFNGYECIYWQVKYGTVLPTTND